jgi:hypothetical protein
MGNDIFGSDADEVKNEKKSIKITARNVFSEEKHGFVRQTKQDRNCAQHSLVHALLLLGDPTLLKIAHKRTSRTRTQTMQGGTKSGDLIKGVNRSNCVAIPIEVSAENEAKSHIDTFLEEGLPVIAHINKASHWIVIAGKDENQNYYWIDSEKAKIIGRDKWKNIRHWLYANSTYYFAGVKPKADYQVDLSLVKRIPDLYPIFKDHYLISKWGYYLEDLLKIFDVPNHTKDVISSKEFFQKYAVQIVDAVQYYDGVATRNNIKTEIINYMIVANAYNMSVTQDREMDALINLSVAMIYI